MILAEARTDRYHAALAEYQGGLRQPWHTHDRAAIVLILRGACREATRLGEASPDPLEIGVKAAGLRHADHFGPAPLRAIRVAPREGIAENTRWRWRHVPAAARAMCRAGWTMLAGDGGDVDGDLDDAVAALTSSGTPVAGVPPSWLARAHQELLDRRGIPRLAELAVHADVHPVYFASRFRAHYGRSVGAVRREVRVREALARFGTTAALSRVAFSAGFADQAHLTRDVRRELGITPARLRRLIGT